MSDNNNYFKQESERLIFRKLTKEDIPSWVEFFINNDRLSFLGIDITRNKEELSREWIMAQLARYKNQGLGHLAVELKDTKEFIGLAGILPRELKGKTEHEISYSLKPNYWNKGYGTEMAKRMKRYGTAHINTPRFISIIETQNLPSINIAKKNGMKMLFETKFLGMNVIVYGIEN